MPRTTKLVDGLLGDAQLAGDPRQAPALGPQARGLPALLMVYPATAAQPPIGSPSVTNPARRGGGRGVQRTPKSERNKTNPLAYPR